MARGRKNASFTLDQTYGSGHGDRSLIQRFYATLNKLYPGDTPVPIPPESQVHPKHDAETQKYIFADYAVRKIVPIALRAVVLEAQAAKLERLKPITDEKTADVAASAAHTAAHTAELRRAAVIGGGGDDDYARDTIDAAYHAMSTAGSTNLGNAKVAAHRAATTADCVAKLNPDATWAAVNEMLQAL